MATGDHGNARCAARRGPTPPPPPGVTHLRTSPEKRRRKQQGGRRPGSRSDRFRVGRVLEGGDLGLASVLRPPVRQSISSSVRPSSRVPLPGRRPLSPASCRLQLSSGAGAELQPKPSQSPRFPEAPQDPAERGGQAGACAERRTGWAGPGLARWGDTWNDPLRPSAAQIYWTGRKSLRRRLCERLRPGRKPLTGGDGASRNSAAGIVASQSRVLCALEWSLNTPR